MNQKFNIVMIGAGNVATHLSEALIKSGQNILQIYSRSEISAKDLAKKNNLSFTTSVDDLNQQADIYIYAVKDDALNELIRYKTNPSALHIHTAGSVDIEIFKGIKSNYGVMYPLQTFSKDKPINFSEIPIFIESSSNEVEQKIKQLAEQISEKIFFISSEQRLLLHISAVFACNFVNFMYILANQTIEKSGLDFSILQPLILETADKIKHLHPQEAQTGPAKRYDANVIYKHIEQLSFNEDMSKIYQLISENIFKNFNTQLK